MKPFDWNAEVKALLAISEWPWRCSRRDIESFNALTGEQESFVYRDDEPRITVPGTRPVIVADFIANSPVQRARMVVEMIEARATAQTPIGLSSAEEQVPAVLSYLEIDPAEYAELVKRLEECND